MAEMLLASQERGESLLKTVGRLVYATGKVADLKTARVIMTLTPILFQDETPWCQQHPGACASQVEQAHAADIMTGVAKVVVSIVALIGLVHLLTRNLQRPVRVVQDLSERPIDKAPIHLRVAKKNGVSDNALRELANRQITDGQEILAFLDKANEEE